MNTELLDYLKLRANLFLSFRLLKALESRLGRRRSPDVQDGTCDVTLRRVLDLSVAGVNEWGCVLRSMSYNKTTSSLLLVGRSRQVSIHFFRLDLYSYSKKLLFLCRRVAQNLRDCLESSDVITKKVPFS